MAPKNNQHDVLDYRFKNATRLNIPPSGLAARGHIVREKKIVYAYNPHLTPTLRFDDTGEADRIEELLHTATQRPLNQDELKLLQAALRNHQPWLEWAGKQEQQSCVVDPVALNIHERISAQAILKVAKREDIQRDLFSDPEQEYREAVQFYQHPMDWTNRMILGDSLAVMASLSRREAMAGKVQMIYMDPPYGIKYASNFQPEVGKRDVKDRDEDLTREPEMVKAYRDTWTLGVHSYLSYLRDRILLARELLADTGSIFVQISDENVHNVKAILDEIFGIQNFICQITFKKTGSTEGDFLKGICDYLLWYVKDTVMAKTKYRQLYVDREGEEGDSSPDPLKSSGSSKSDNGVFEVFGKIYLPGDNEHWKTNPNGRTRLAKCERITPLKSTVRFKKEFSDYPVMALGSLWYDTGGASNMKYVVQTSERIIERCMLMTTDPGDIVLDPTCGSGTTATVAEQWGRRWITIDVSRVALAIARQRLLTAKFDYYKLRPTSAEDVRRNNTGVWLNDPEGNIEGSCTFDCKTVPHITLKSIANNQALDPIFAKWEPIMQQKLDALNSALNEAVTKELRTKLLAKLQKKQSEEGKAAITDADKRRWILPPDKMMERDYTTVPNDFNGWYDWEVPFDADPDWPEAMRTALEDYRANWRRKMDEINECIAARADEEELVDQPKVDSKKVRVSGPFTYEGVIPVEESIIVEESPIDGAPEELETFVDNEVESQNAEASLARMIRLRRGDGVRFPNNKEIRFNRLEALADGSILHAEGSWGTNGDERRVAVMFGPQYGPLVAPMVEEGIRIAARRGYDDLVFAAFNFDGVAQAVIQEDPDPRLRIHLAHISPDVNMGDLLKDTQSSQLFTVSGAPRTTVKQEKDGQFTVKMEGVDIYNPATNKVVSTGAGKVAAWFLDADYDGRTFCVTQAFFPDKSAWNKLGKALRGAIDPEAFKKLSGTESLPFPMGKYKRVAIKVIDPRGNEVMRVHRLGGSYE